MFLLQRPLWLAAAMPPASGGGGGPVEYDADSLTLFARMSPEPDATRKGHINDLIVALKANGTWAKRDFLYVTAADTEANALLDWKDSGIDAENVLGAAFAADRGFTNAGNTVFAAAGSPDGLTLYTQDDAHFAIWSRTAAASALTGLDVGAGAALGATLGIAPRTSAGNVRVQINDATASVTANADGSGLFVAVRPDAATKRIYRNGAQVGSDFAVASTAVDGDALRFGGMSNNNREYAMMSAGSALTAGEIAGDYTAFAAYMVAVGAA